MTRWVVLLFCGLGLHAASPELRLTIVYDNITNRVDMPADWGFSTLVDFRGHRVLFDVGARPELLLANLKALGVEKSSIERTVISHGNSEAGILGRVIPTGILYFMEGFLPRSNAAAQATGLKLDLAKQPREIAPGIFSTGEIPGALPEQALLIETSKGLVMLVSCAHPGIAKMVEAAEKQRGVHSIRLLLGGLHMYDWNEKEIRFVVSQLQKLRVESVIPTHCSGALTKTLLHEAYGSHYDWGGAGKQIVLD